MVCSEETRTRVSKSVASALEEGIAIVSRPFEDIARRLGVSESEVLRIARLQRDSGFLRHFGPFLDFRSFGKKGYLFGLSSPRGRTEDFASYVSGLPSVTHSYRRDHRLDLWFTAILGGRDSAETFCETLRGMGLEFIALDSGRRIKLRTSFAISRPLATEDKPEETEPAFCRLDAEQLSLITALQDDIDLVPRPFARVADAEGTSEDSVIEGVRRLMSGGALRRIGASVDHRRAGYTCNSLTAWDLSGMSDESATALAKRATAARPWASHCYLRRIIFSNAALSWPYNLYIMIHASNDPEMAERERLLGRDLGSADFVSLRTLEEYKKVPYRYVPE
ncbi:MAG: hypothetical protein LBO21_09220 [Synergistaceae bacterium]|jgi:DNA-binding Lrp family transcriptional regulator|nr:hypothetical protein [Synergistaceae bacterium]